MDHHSHAAHAAGGARPVEAGGDPYGTHRALDPRGALPQLAWRVDNDFTRLFEGEVLIDVGTLNLDAASFAQIEGAAYASLGEAAAGAADAGHTGDMEHAIAHIVLRTVSERGKQHNPVTGSGGMLVGRVLQVARPGEMAARAGDLVASLVSLTLSPLRIDGVRAVRRRSAQIDVDGEAVLFATSAFARLPDDLPERVALAALDVAGAAPQVARLVQSGSVALVLGAGGKSGILCAAEARKRAGRTGMVVGVEAALVAGDELRALDLCDVVVTADARDPLAVRRALLEATGGREADVTFSCVNAPDTEMAAILATRDRGTVYFFAMSTSFTQAALGAEGVGKDVDLFIGNGFAHGHAEHTLALLRDSPGVRALFERRYG